MDRSDATVVTVRYGDGRAQRWEYEPRSDGRYDVTERVLTEGGTFRVVGEDIAETVDVETPD